MRKRHAFLPKPKSPSKICDIADPPLRFAVVNDMLTDTEIENCRRGISYVVGYKLIYTRNITHPPIDVPLYQGRRWDILINQILDQPESREP